MFRQNRLQLKILSLATAATLLSGCAHRAPTEPTTTTAFQKLTAEPTETVVTKGTEETILAAEPFYYSEDIILTPPEVKDPQGRKVYSALCQNPKFVGDRIITEVYITFEEALPDTDESDITDYYWAIFDLNGQYVGRFQKETIGVRPGFTLDEQGNIVAAFAKSSDPDGSNMDSLFIQKFDRSGAPISEEKKIYTSGNGGLPYSELICSDALGTVIACGNVLIQLDKNDEILCREEFDNSTLFAGFLKENGQYYLQILSPRLTDEETGYLSLEALSLDSDGFLQHKEIDRNAETLLGMRVYQTESGVYSATRNAFGKLNIADGTFSTMFDWNQTDIDRSYLFESQVKVLTEGELSEPLLILPDNGVTIDPQPMPSVEPSVGQPEQETSDTDGNSKGTPVSAPDVTEPESSTSMETTTSEPDTTSVEDPSGERKTSILIASTSYTLMGAETHLMKVEMADENPHAGQDVVWVGGIEITDTPLMKSISSYNKDTSKDIWIKVYDYSAFGALYAVDKSRSQEAMMAQINSGVGPDIIIGSDKMLSLDNSRIFTNLNGYIDSPSGINREEYFDSAFRAYESEGKLYRIPLGFQAYAMLGSNEAANGRTDLDYTDYIGMRLSKGTDAQIISYGYSDELFNMFVEGELSTWIDYANNKVQINKSSLENMFSLVKLEAEARHEEDIFALYSSENGFNPHHAMYPAEPFPFEGATDLYNHEAAFCLASVNSLSEFMYKEMIPGQLSWYGYPGSAGCTPIITAPISAGITSYSTQKDKAWEVIKYMLSEDMQYSSNIDSAGLPGDRSLRDTIPVNIEAFRKLNKESTEKNVQLNMVASDPEVVVIQMDQVDKILDEYEEFLKKPLRRQICDNRAISAVRMCFGKFLSGESDISEAVDSVEKEIRSFYEQ
ncbi:MAG: hypothetical protein J6Y58_05445 [Clostridiales bacterium]|nr:hypothetical protein [Clostridiales bacterium]